MDREEMAVAVVVAPVSVVARIIQDNPIPFSILGFLALVALVALSILAEREQLR